MSYSISSFSNYWNEDNYPNIASGDYSSNTAQNTGFITDPYMSIDSSIFSSADDYSSDYDAIFDAFHKEMDEIAAEREAQEAQKTDETDETDKTDKTEGTDSTDKTEGTTGTSSTDKTDSDEEVDGDESESDTEGSKAGDDDSDSLVAEHQEKVRDGFDAEAIARSLNTAANPGIFGWGTDEKVFSKYFDGKDGYAALNGAELAQVAEAYESKYGKSLEQLIRDEFSWSQEDMYIGKIKNATETIDICDDDGNVVATKYLCDAANDEELSEDFLKHMAEKFYDSTVAQWGTDEEQACQVLGLEPDVLKQVIEYYNNSSLADGKDFKKALNDDFGDINASLAYSNAMSGASNKTTGKTSSSTAKTTSASSSSSTTSDATTQTAPKTTYNSGGTTATGGIEYGARKQA